MIFPTVRFQIIDHSAEKSSFGVPMEALDETSYDNFVGVTLPALRAAIDAITLGNIQGSEVAGVVYVEAGSLPVNVWAQREIKGRFKFVDDVNNRPMLVSVPALDLDNVAQFGTDVIDITGNAFALAYITAVITHAVSPNGNAISINTAKLVGVNN